MIIKIKSHKKPNFHKLLDYMLHDKDRLFDKEGRSFVLTHNLKGDSIDSWVKQYEANEKTRQRKRIDSVYLTHEILSWHKDDAENISLDKLEDIAREYIQKRNSNGIYVAVPHFDKEHYHIHICASGIEYKTGKALRLSKTELQKLKQEIQNYQIEKYPELSKSVVVHGKQNERENAKQKKEVALSDNEYQYKQRTGRATDKEQILSTLKTCYKKANSKIKFFELLKESGLTTYIRGGKIYGITYKKRKYRFKTLGFTEERINELEVGMKRGREIEKLRVQKQVQRKEIRKER